MKDQFVPYEHSRMLKDIGFNYQCPKYYSISTIREVGKNTEQEFQTIHTTNCYNSEMKDNDDCSAPLWQQAEQWLWEKYRMSIKVFGFYPKYDSYIYENDEFVLISKTFDSPIATKQDAIIKSIEYLHKKLTP